VQDKDTPIFQNLSDALGVYLHVPFCARLCDFCKFYKLKPSAADFETYLGALKIEADALAAELAQSGKTPLAMFWGGGTPTALSESHLARAAKILSPFAPQKEWTVEAAPSTLSPAKLKLLKELGVNRISLGVQSFSQNTLNALGRPHSEAAARRAIDLILETGFEKFSVDLIFAGEGQTLDSFAADIKAAAACGANHISAYCLEFESGTSCCAGGGKNFEENAREAAFLELALEELQHLGFKQYEVSNYAREGFECLHNMIIWNMGEWLGLGPAAASQWAGLRRKNIDNLDLWAQGLKAGTPRYADIVKLDDEEIFSSALIFGLRLNAGVDILKLKARCPKADFDTRLKTLEALEAEGLAEIKDARSVCGHVVSKRVRLTKRGRMLADAIAVELL